MQDRPHPHHTSFWLVIKSATRTCVPIYNCEPAPRDCNLTWPLSNDQLGRPSLIWSNPSSFSPSPILSSRPRSCPPDSSLSSVPLKHCRRRHLLHLCFVMINSHHNMIKKSYKKVWSRVRKQTVCASTDKWHACRRINEMSYVHFRKEFNSSIVRLGHTVWLLPPVDLF